MIAFGMLCLGLFFGAVTTIYIRQIKGEWKDPKAILGVISTTLVSGVVLAFIQFFSSADDKEPVAWYPVGLFLALIWGFGHVAIFHIRGLDYKGEPRKDPESKVAEGWLIALGFLHIIGLLLITALVLALLLSPDVRKRLNNPDPIATDQSE